MGSLKKEIDCESLETDRIQLRSFNSRRERQSDVLTVERYKEDYLSSLSNKSKDEIIIAREVLNDFVKYILSL